MFYSEVAGRWQMDAGANFFTIKYCPFCGLELSLELRAEQDDEKRSHTGPEPWGGCQVENDN